MPLYEFLVVLAEPYAMAPSSAGPTRRVSSRQAPGPPATYTTRWDSPFPAAEFGQDRYLTRGGQPSSRVPSHEYLGRMSHTSQRSSSHWYLKYISTSVSTFHAQVSTGSTPERSTRRAGHGPRTSPQSSWTPRGTRRRTC